MAHNMDLLRSQEATTAMADPNPIPLFLTVWVKSLAVLD